MAEVKWVKLTVDMFDNRKIKYIRKLPEGNNIVLIWVMLLTMAGRCNAGGMIFLTENVPYTPKMLADELDFEENTVILALQALENLNMIVADNGFFAIAGWDKYQNIDGMEKIKEQNRKRQAKFKKKKKLLIGNVTDNVTVTQGNATEEEKEEEKEKEEEIHSFIHSNVREGEDAEKEPTGNFDDRESIRLKYLGGTLGKGVVMLSDEQFADLLDKLSVEEFDKYVSIVAECELKGKRYTNKTHYQAILDMAKKDRKVI
jgi:predicted phage replisome organizer